MWYCLIPGPPPSRIHTIKKLLSNTYIPKYDIVSHNKDIFMEQIYSEIHWYCLIPPTPYSHNKVFLWNKYICQNIYYMVSSQDPPIHPPYIQAIKKFLWNINSKVESVYLEPLYSNKLCIFIWIWLPWKSSVCKWGPHITWSGHKQRLDF